MLVSGTASGALRYVLKHTEGNMNTYFATAHLVEQRSATRVAGMQNVISLDTEIRDDRSQFDW